MSPPSSTRRSPPTSATPGSGAAAHLTGSRSAATMPLPPATSSSCTPDSPEVAMYNRVTTLSGVKDIDGFVASMQETALAALRAQRGYKGLSISADRSNGLVG